MHDRAAKQALAVLQGVPSTSSGLEQIPVAGLQTPATWQSSRGAQTTGFDPTHAPPWHVFVLLQAFAPVHAVPSLALGLLQTPVAGLHTPATWHWSCGVQMTAFDPTHEPF